jgi:hypothetical protein
MVAGAFIILPMQEIRGHIKLFPGLLYPFLHFARETIKGSMENFL